MGTTMKNKLALTAIALAMGIASIAPLQAKVTPEVAKQQGTTLTEMGAEPGANANGSIPEWSGTMFGLPEGLKYDGPGTPYPDPYGDDKVLFTITADNMAEHADKLGEGQVALFKAYPETFKMNIYPSHRDGRTYDSFIERLKFNAVNAELQNGEDGII